jgi:NADH-ubiquinone oxidoreductase chain 4
VAHIGIVISGLITINHWGFIGSYVLIIGHGLCSSGLFCLSNIVYERVGRRSILINKGLIRFIPRLSLWWFLFRSRNIAAPPSLNLLGEIILINRVISWSWIRIIILSFISFFSAAYSLYLFAYRQHGIFFSLSKSFRINYFREYMLLFLHWFPLNILIIKCEYFSLWI